MIENKKFQLIIYYYTLKNQKSSMHSAIGKVVFCLNIFKNIIIINYLIIYAKNKK